MCEGDCDSHDDCQPGLVCYERDGNEPVPFCDGDDVFGNDYCTFPVLNTIENDLGFLSYDLCQGDCDRDGDCKNGLHCFQRDGLIPSQDVLARAPTMRIIALCLLPKNKGDGLWRHVSQRELFAGK